MTTTTTRDWPEDRAMAKLRTCNKYMRAGNRLAALGNQFDSQRAFMRAAHNYLDAAEIAANEVGVEFPTYPTMLLGAVYAVQGASTEATRKLLSNAAGFLAS